MLLGIRRLCSTMPFYAVRVGRKPGIYNTWDECKANVAGFPKARYKKFDTKHDADNFIGEGSAGNVSQSKLEKLCAEKVLSVKNDIAFKAKDADKKVKQIKHIPIEDTMRHKFMKRDNLPTSAVVYTDGCCLSNGRAGAVAGVGVYWAPHHPMNVSEYLDVESPSNQKAELRAASRALETALEMGLKSVELRTDSIYTIKSMTEWIKRWKENGWRTAGNKEVVNKEEMIKLAELCTKISVIWVHVAGHQGIYGNEEADRLAREGALIRNS